MTVTKIQAYGTSWFRGKGSQAAMQSHALLHEHQCHIARHEPQDGDRLYGSYTTWAEACDNLKNVARHLHYFYEVMLVGNPCKIYFDFDHQYAEKEKAIDRDAFMTEFESILIESVRTLYDVNVSSDHFHWSETKSDQKFSLHLTVAPILQRDGETVIFVYSDNRFMKHLHDHIIATYPIGDHPLVHKCMDKNVYTRNRCMRLIGSTKFRKNLNLQPIDQPMASQELTTEMFETYNVTCYPTNVRLQTFHIPDILENVVRQANMGQLRINQKQINTDDHAARVLSLVQKHIHPTAVYQSGPDDKGLYRFNYTDRREECFTGHFHDGQQNFSCVVNEETRVVSMQCYSSHCKGEYYLGSLDEEEVEYVKDRIIVDTPFVSDIMDDAKLPLIKEKVIGDFRNGVFQALHIKSGLGTGKSTLLSRLHDSDGVIPEGATCLVLTYRQSLAIELAERKLKQHGYVNYLDLVRDDEPIWDQTKYPRVVLQIDSLERLTENAFKISFFDFIIIDEVELAFAHFNSSTLADARRLFIKLGLMFTKAKIITMDGLWSDTTYRYFREEGISQRIIENVTHTRGLDPEHQIVFDLTNAPTSQWFEEIAERLMNDENIVVATLSQNIGHALIDHVKNHTTLDIETDVVFHYSKQSDETKHSLADVENFWSSKRLVIYTSTIETGTDFNIKHFDRMYVYACGYSASSAALVQMVGRARSRHLKCQFIKVYIGNHVTITMPTKRLVSRDFIVKHSMWRDRQISNKYYPQLNQAIERMQCNFEYEVRDDCMLPVVGHKSVLYMMATTEANRMNDATRFMINFQDYIRQLGHRSIIHIYDNNLGEDAGDDDEKQEKLKVAEYYLTASKYDEKLLTPIFISDLESRIKHEVASEEDKWLMHRRKYLSYYGFKWVDLEFVRDYGTNLFNPIKTVLLAMVWPEYVIEPSGDWKKHNIIQKATMLNELVSAFGFKHILDYETEVKAVDINSLAKCQYFREYEQACALFELEYNPRKKWTTALYLQSFRNLLMYRLNIQLENKRIRLESVRTRIYTLNKESVQRMGDMCVTTIDVLDKNWITKSGHRMLPLAKEALIACRDTHFAKYKQLLKPLPIAPTTEMEALTI